MDAEKIGVHQLPNVSVCPQLVTIESVHRPHRIHTLSSIQENPYGKISEKMKKNGEEGEIGVFSAEKYFSMKLDDAESTENNEQGNRSSEDLPWMRTRSRPGTPSLRSESSYSSQTFLLRNSMMMNYHNHHQTRDNNKHRRMKCESIVSLGGFRCNGPCSGGKSANTNRKILSHERRSRSGRDAVITSNARKHLHKPRIPIVEVNKLNHHGSKAEDFFAKQIQKADIAMNLERKLSMLTWDAIPNATSSCYLKPNKNNKGSSIGSKRHEDAASDASSELFEIENITSSIYEPSEASVNWSVVTGSMADQSLVSDFDDKKFSSGNKVIRDTISPVAGNKSLAASGVGKGRAGGILSGCKSYKAVSVVESAYRNENQAKVHQLPRRKFQTEVRIQDLDFL